MRVANKLKIYYESEELKPHKKHYDDAGLDLKAKNDYIIYPSQTLLVQTGVYTVLDKGYYGRIVGRSSVSLRGLLCKEGTIDSSYRGELKVILHNTTNRIIKIKQYERIAQLIIAKCELDYTVNYGVPKADTERGINGFGSTGRL